MHEHKSLDKILLGFWVYLMTDLLMFSVLFATFAVLRNNTFGAATIWEIFNPPFVLTETTILLVSSLLAALQILQRTQKTKLKRFFFWQLHSYQGFHFQAWNFMNSQVLLWKETLHLEARFSPLSLRQLELTVFIFWLVLSGLGFFSTLSLKEV